jgi:hypothetical protein
MLYSIVGIDYHKSRAVSTKTFENTPLSAACKKKKWKLWQKERGLGGASPLDKAMRHINMGLQNLLRECGDSRTYTNQNTARFW